MRLRLIAFLLAAGIAANATATTIAGEVIRVADGDTLTIWTGSENIRIRLAQIDAPESGQPFSSVSRSSLAEICFRKRARVTVVDRDRYGRIVGMVDCDGVDANREQVARGLAWVYDDYVTDRTLYGVQDAARQVRSNIWSDPNPVRPWSWRRLSR